MFDPATAVQDAAFAALNVPLVTGLGAEVWSHSPEIDEGDDPLASGSIVLVHDISLTPEGGKDGGLDRATLTIVTLVRKPARSALSALQATVRKLLETSPVVTDGALLSQPVLVAAESGLMEDGATYMGTQRFELLVQPA